MGKTEKRTKRVMMMLTESEHEQLVKEAERAHIPKSVLCRKLISAGNVRVAYRKPAEMAMLEKIYDTMSQIMESDMEMLRQLRLMGEWTEQAQKTIEDQIKEINLLRKSMEGEGTYGDY